MLQDSVIFRYYIAQSLLITTAREAAPSFCKMTELGHGRRHVWAGGGSVVGVRGGDSQLGCGRAGLSRARGARYRVGHVGAQDQVTRAGRLVQSRWLGRTAAGWSR
jgi:hypothetical protein